MPLLHISGSILVLLTAPLTLNFSNLWDSVPPSISPYNPAILAILSPLFSVSVCPLSVLVSSRCLCSLLHIYNKKKKTFWLTEPWKSLILSLYAHRFASIVTLCQRQQQRCFVTLHFYSIVCLFPSYKSTVLMRFKYHLILNTIKILNINSYQTFILSKILLWALHISVI